MKICLVSTPAIKIVPPNNFGYAGSELQVSLLAEGLNDRGHDVTVIAPEGSYLNDIRIYRTVEAKYGGRSHEKAHFEEYKDFVLSEDWDIVDDHSHFFTGRWLKEENPDLNITFSCHDWLPMRNFPSKKVKILARSRAHAENLSRAWGEEVDYVYNGIDLSRFEYRENKEDFALFFGRMSHIKGPLEFARICKKVGMKGVIAGEDSIERGVEPETPWKVIKECNETDLLTYLGRVSPQKKRELFSKVRVYISPLPGTHIPPFDLTNIEAAASGTPAIATKIGAIPEVINHGVSGFVADKIADIPTLMERIDKISSQNCREHAKGFSKERLVDRYLEKYEGVIQDSG